MPTDTSSRIKDQSQKRAAFAYEQVKKASEKLGDKERKEFKSHVKDVPMMIRSNGLAAAYAFVFSKKEKKDYQLIIEISEAWLLREQKVFSEANGSPFTAQLVRLEPELYRRSTKELLALFTWLKRFADGIIIDPTTPTA